MPEKTMRFFFGIILLLALNTQFSHAQNEAFWPDQRQMIPGLEREVFDLDASHSKLRFSIGFLGFSDVEGSFDRFGGTILYNESDLEKTSVSIVIDATSISTGSNFRDKDLQKENFFDTENHRIIRFISKEVKRRGKKLEIVGDLTIKGKTKEVVIPFERTKQKFVDPFWQHIMIGFKGELALNRTDFDVHGGRWGEKVLSEEVKIAFSMVGKQSNDFKTGKGEKSSLATNILEEIIANGVESGKAKYLSLEEDEGLDAFYTTLIARRLIQKDFYAQALAFLDFALEKFPDQAPRVNRYKAKCYAYLGDVTKAKIIYQQIDKQNPFDTEAWEMLKHLK